MLTLAAVLPVAQAQNASAPTSSQDPADIDQVWQKASSKYDARRDAVLKQVDETKGPFSAAWESLRNYEVPEWYKDAKFGIFIHWGVYSVPAFGNEWYPRNMYRRGSEEYAHHLALYGSQDKFGYKDFIPMFKAERFDPAGWAELFRKAGAKYVVPVAEHHDGFAMYDSGLSDWTAARMGPHRDIIGELANTVRTAGLHFGVSSHRVEHNFFFDVGRTIPSDVNDPKYAAFYGPAHAWLANASGTPLNNDFTYVSSAWSNDWLARASELVDKYHPDIVYFDWWIGQPSLRPNLARFAAYYYNQSLRYGDHVGVINYKDYAMPEYAGVLDVERGELGDTRSLYWQTDTSVSNKSWGYIKNDSFKSPDFVVHELIDVVSKNGNLLLNIGPRSDGVIPEEVQRVLLEVGSWLDVNGEGIFSSRPWRTYGEGPTKMTPGAFHDADSLSYTAEDFRFTTRGDTLYAIGMRWPGNSEVLIRSLAQGVGTQRVGTVSLLGSDVKLQFEQEAQGLRVHLPPQPPTKYAYVLRIGFNQP
ncbi:MAG: alpha-L-fucosidase [Acidobacteria bacterium]|nr:alpha-L-fucosidase [Acidobacteriota bacterium]MBV9436458.1 alpha-L-fucosidase [Acidobacteriota bacterium]